MTILGIDPGLSLTGYGVVRFVAGRADLLDAGVIRLSRSMSVPDRLVELDRELSAILDEHHPDRVAVEKLYAHYNHPRTALIMGHARGVIILAARRTGAQLDELPANRVKLSLTGHGHAAKSQVQRAIQATWNLPSLPHPPDVADALAIALCAGRQLQTHRRMKAAARS